VIAPCAVVVGAALFALWAYLADRAEPSVGSADPWGECLGPPSWCRRLATFGTRDAGAQADAGPPPPGASALDAGARDDRLDDR